MPGRYAVANAADLLASGEDGSAASRRAVGGVMEFLECEDVSALTGFYEANGFRAFGERVASEEHTVRLVQMMRFV